VGVDVFFVISGFLITGLLLREFVASGRIDLPAFYARRARRLLPAALVVIIVTIAASAVVLAKLRFPDVAEDGAAAALYVSNYRFALSATDYFAAAAPSPLLHYWSLGVEEQFYLFWPLLILFAARLLSVRRLWLVVALIGISSLALSIVVTNIEAPWAFYSLPTRAWQLALGALVALGVLALPARWPAHLASALGGIGVVMIGIAVLLINGTTSFPGVAALLPAVGTALVIVAGEHPKALTARLLATGPPRAIGRISYSLYLWHWPLLILVPAVIGHNGLRIRVMLALVAIGVAALSTRFIETPLRAGRSSRLTSGRTLAMSGVISVAIAFGALLASGTFLGAPSAAAVPSLPPPSAVKPRLPEPILAGPLPDNLQPPLLTARNDKPRLGADGCQTPITDSQLRDCVYGDATAPTTVIVFGDSHAEMWLPAIQALAAEKHWRIVPLVKPACTPVEVTVWRKQLLREFRECDEWRELALQRMATVHPAIVFIASSRNYVIVNRQGHRGVPGHSPAWRAGLASVLARLRQSADRVILFGETPHQLTDPVECLADHDLIEDCPVPRTEVVDTDYQALETRAAHAAGADLITTTDWLCTQGACPLVMGDYLVYRDPGHVTATIATVLAPQLRWAFDHLP
jgi:peptidoglycan/LPS O-acetylase OafA/YrhL